MNAPSPNPLTNARLQLDSSELPRYIAIEGPIGAGKTTLAKKLAETFHYPLLLEPVSENPFLTDFYREARSNALPTQLFFLLNRARQIGELAEDDLFHPTLVADFLIEKDRLFAQINLDQDELQLYEQIYRKLDINAPPPDLVIYLQAPVNILSERIKRRGIASEQYIEQEYLTRLINAYTRFFHFYDVAPLLIVNAADSDFGNNDEHFSRLLNQITRMDGVRQYFNPQPSLL